MNITLTVTPRLETIAGNIAHLGDTLMEDFNWGSIAPIIAEAADDLFASEGRGQWESLNEDYAARKAKHYPGKGILEKTGTYRKAATQVGAPYNVIEVGDDSLTYGVEGLAYPEYHEGGTERLPARPVFEMLAEDEGFVSDVTGVIDEHINRKLSEIKIAR